MGEGEKIDKLDELLKAKFICLETYKKNGEPVRTPVWFTVEGGKVYFHTPLKSGKVKRLRRNPNLRLAPCTRTGKVIGDWLKGKATELDEQESERVIKLVNSRLGLLDKIISIFICRIYGKRVTFQVELVEQGNLPSLR